MKNLIKPNIGKNNHEIRAKWVVDELNKIPEKTRILDAGAGTQRFKQNSSHLEYVSQDFAQYKPNKEEKGLQNPAWNYGELDIVSDIINIPEPNESFGAILCSEVLEHIPYPDKAIGEFGRLLKPNGTLLITAPFCALTHQAPFFYCTGFSSFFYEKILTENGFTDIEITLNGSYFEYMAQEIYRLNSVSKQYTKNKKGLNIYQKIISLLFLRILDKQSKKDVNSNELLCYGLLIKCKKI